MLRICLILLLGLISAPAAAGLRATYGGSVQAPMVVEIADNGDVDADLGIGHRHLLIVAGRSYIVEERLTGPVVDRLEDLAAFSITVDADGLTAPSVGERRGTAEISGRTGQAWFLRGATGRGAAEPIAVISSEASLAPLGAVMRRVFAARLTVTSIEAHFPPEVVMTEAELLRLLDEGAPLKFGNYNLRTLEPIAVPRFTLPAEPESAEATGARRAAQEQAQPSGAGRAISRAVFAQGRLWLLDDGGRLSSLADGETRLRSEEVGENVLDICVRDGAPVALTGQRDSGERWTIRHLTGTWRATRAIARAGDELVALSCGDGVAMALTTRRLIDLGGTIPDLAITLPLQLPRVTAAQLVTPAAAWLGINAGEWGGGLRRIDRRTGAVSTIARNATGDLCDGPLNTDCDPVNGVVAIPWRPSCVAVAIGLIHLEAHGRIASVCPEGIEQLFAAADAVDPGDPRRVAEAARGGSGSVAFFGLAATADALLAVGHDGLYRIDARGIGTRRPWPRFTEVDGMLVSFALPDVVLVMTAINGRASLSGITPLMAVR